MPIEGELVVRIASRANRVTRASASSERPRVASRLLRGRAADEAEGIAGSVFAICGRSQSIAARSAVDAIRGWVADAAESRLCERRIAAETLHEHAWRLFVDAPRWAGGEPAIEAFAPGRRLLATLMDTRDEREAGLAASALAAWSHRSLLGRAPDEFLSLDSIAGLDDWMNAAGTPVARACAALLADSATLGASQVAFLPAARDDWVASALAPAIDADAGFDDRPQLEGAARETGAIARTHAHPLVSAAIGAWGRGFGARLVARLVEAALLVASMPAAQGSRHGAAATGAGQGISWVETSRGLLVHRVALDGDRIAAYRVVAPTEWNFHPEGAFAQGARGLAAADAAHLDADVMRLVASLDPCVSVRYEASHA